jgi:hypothetical protein
MDPELRVGERKKERKKENAYREKNFFHLGLLIAKKKLLRNCGPIDVGGVSVVSVSRTYVE